MPRSVVLVVLLALGGVILLTGCADRPLTVGEARATAQAGGCWPAGVRQPLPPTPPPATATPRLQPPAPPTLTPTGPVAAGATPWVVYPPCPPAPGTPTVPPMPTDTPRPYVPPTPQPAAAITAPHELQDTLGVVREQGLGWAYNPRAQGPVVVWIEWGWRPDQGTDGQIWVASRAAGGTWRDPQRLNPTPVIRTYGGAAVAAAPDGALRVLYGSGDPDPGRGSTIFEVRSDDDGATWSLPRAVGPGAVGALRADHQGGWHAVAIGPVPFDDQLRYGYAPPGGTWTWTPLPGARREGRADLALLELDGRLVRLILTVRQGTPADPQPHLHIYRSVDGMQWERVAPAALLPGAIDNPTVRPQILAVPRGDGLVAAAWSNYGSGMVVASLSTDGGRTFGPSEVIAQHAADRSISPDWPYGIEPSLAYDPESDTLLASWVEVQTDAGPTFPWPVTSYLARRPLDHPLGAPWLEAVTPDTRDRPRRRLDPQRRAYLYARPDGRAAGLIIVDERNYQFRLTYREVWLPELATTAES